MRTPRLNSRANRACQARSGGFTLIEVLIALALFAIIGIAFAGGLATASRAVLTADVRTRAESLARTQMESVKNPSEEYRTAPDGGVANYTKISDIPEGYSICSLGRTGPPANCLPGDPILAVPWDSGNNTAVDEDIGLQKITVVIKHEDEEVTRLEGYKVDR